MAGLNLDQIRSLTDIIRLVILEFRGESHKQAAVLLNEGLLFEKYLQILL